MLRIFRRARQTALSERKFMRFFRYALGEIFLVVVGILIALQINNWNEERKEQRQIADYARALSSDLKADIVMLETVLSTSASVVRSAEDLRNYMWKRDIEDVDNLRLAYHTTYVSYRPYSWNLSALQQLINSGALRQMKNAELVRMISEYNASSRHLDQDFLLDMKKSGAAEALATELVDSSFPDQELFAQLTWGSPYGYPPTGFLEAFGDVDSGLLLHDSAKMKALVNAFSKLGEQIFVRVEVELPEHIEQAQQLIELLEAEYPK
jgi:hypothetical protein